MEQLKTNSTAAQQLHLAGLLGVDITTISAAISAVARGGHQLGEGNRDLEEKILCS